MTKDNDYFSGWPMMLRPNQELVNTMAWLMCM